MINGIINIYKEKGFTSHDVVAKLRGMVRQKKIGHTGTLDPDAEGVLPVCLGKATRLCDMLTDKDKTYQAVLLLGTATDTQDITGTILAKSDTAHVSGAEVMDCINNYIGEYEQLPPMYSALKVNGKKLYELAREGREVERKTRKVVIHNIKILDIALPRVRMEVSCSKGTYIRTLCHDIGESLGCGGCMESLLRTRVGCFSLGDSYTLGRLAEILANEGLARVLTPVDQMFADLKKVTVLPGTEALAYNGNEIQYNHISEQAEYMDGEPVRLYDVQGHFIGVFRYCSDNANHLKGTFHVEKMFLDHEEIIR